MTLSRFKGPRVSTKTRRRRKSAKRAKIEVSNMEAVRLEDGRCRFPCCGCHRRHMPTEVAHLEHRGQGGNPKLDRSDPGKLILFDYMRHRTSRISVDAGTLEIRPLTGKGTRGACAFWIDKRALTMTRAQLGAGRSSWFLLATEIEPGKVDVLTAEQAGILVQLARMEV